MNSPLACSKETIQKKSLALPFGYAAAILLALSACSPKKEEKTVSTPHTPPNTSGETISDGFCAHLTGTSFDIGVRNKIQEIGKELPEITTLFSGLQTLPNHTIQFFDRDGFLKYLQQNGTAPQVAENYILDAGAMTFIPDKKRPSDPEHICIYLSPHALANKENFIRGVTNELLNAFMAIKLPAELESKKRWPDATGGLNISTKEMRGIGIEFAKEYISGLLSTLILEKYNKKDVACSLSELRENLRKGIFWHTDTPNYALEYFYEILYKNGFPVEKNTELLKLYGFCLDKTWPDIARNTKNIGQWLDLPITE